MYLAFVLNDARFDRNTPIAKNNSLSIVESVARSFKKSHNISTIVIENKNGGFVKEV